MGENKLPEDPEKGERHTLLVNSSETNIGSDRLVTLEATGKKGWGKWKIVDNEKATKENLGKAENIEYDDSSSTRGSKGQIRELKSHKHRRW